MRPNQNRRMRGRNRPKGPNPLTRSYESNGPDVKLRGTAQHIADKYAQLARDALSSGDPVAAENYFQHGEHYFRIVTGAQETQRPQSLQGYARNGFDDEEEIEDGAAGNAGGYDQGRQGYGQSYGRGGNDEYGDPGQQPQPFERHDFDGRQSRNDRPERQDRQDRVERQDRPERNDRPERSDRQDFRRDRFQNRNDRPRAEGERNDYGRGDSRPDPRNGPRNEGDRYDHAPRQDSRQDARQDTRQDARQDTRNEPVRADVPREGGRYENNRTEQPRQGDFPRRGERRREEAPRAPVEEAPGLPAFLMTATRNVPPVEAAPVDAPPARTRKANPEVEAESVLAQDTDDGATAPKPRRRRARYKGSEAADAQADDTKPVDTSSAAE